MIVLTNAAATPPSKVIPLHAAWDDGLYWWWFLFLHYIYSLCNYSLMAVLGCIKVNFPMHFYHFAIILAPHFAQTHTHHCFIKCEKWFMCRSTLSGNTRNTKEYKDETGSRKSLPFKKVSLPKWDGANREWEDRGGGMKSRMEKMLGENVFWKKSFT